MADARIDTVVDTVFGQELVDPYRWMEQDGPELHEWLDAQADTAARYLSGLPGRPQLLSRVAELSAAAVTVSRFAMAGEHVFFLRQDGNAAVAVLVVRTGDDERVLLDPAGEHGHIDWYVPSPDGRRIACGISQGGSEQSVLHVLDVATGQWDHVAIPGTFHGGQLAAGRVRLRLSPLPATGAGHRTGAAPQGQRDLPAPVGPARGHGRAGARPQRPHRDGAD